MKAVCAEKVAQNVLQERMDLPPEVSTSIEVTVEEKWYSLKLESKELMLPNVFFSNAVGKWLSKETLPTLPLKEFSNPELKDLKLPVPVLFGNEEEKDPEKSLPIDIFGSIYFQLSRYEEAVVEELDSHQRFPATASLAYKGDFLERPLVDEYREIFWVYFSRIWPRVIRQKREPRTIVSCDIDWPKDPAASSFYYSSRKALGRVVREKSIPLALNVMSNYWSSRGGSLAKDPFHHGIQWMMDVNEKAGNQVTFNFIPKQTHSSLDHPYPFDSEEMRTLVGQIHKRGHLIGFHPGYDTFNNPKKFKESADIFWRVIDAANIQQNEFGGRQHFLRWQQPATAKLWEENGFSYDSTLGFADRAGFRCSTSREFSMFGLDADNWLMRLKQQPLVLMECTVMAKRYMGLGQSDKALQYMQSLKKTCEDYGGDFTLLWHNTEVSNPHVREIYQQLI